MVLLIKICSNFCGYFQANEHDRSTRNKSIFVRLPKVELEYNIHAFRFAGAKIYNELPVRIRFKTFSRTTLRLTRLVPIQICVTINVSKCFHVPEVMNFSSGILEACPQCLHSHRGIMETFYIKGSPR